MNLKTWYVEGSDIKTAIDVPKYYLFSSEADMLAVKGLSEHTVRMLIARGELASLRTGEGKHGKILVPKKILLDYIHKIQD